ncbi:flagellar basal body rod protein FlgB [Geothermobacter hydrogeniphilus]|uniref:Flagellar basal body rod protein FlgB n=1 Tax=Geothermobacter hydrogeniphilus TaxID=1969733 RepID=A0A2K2HCT4_9BACT|nr:flagellar basal body rod protein FlgB [Geothermobacter hydrogeniphilus]PNU21112.1 flagellar basal body rod protein FlgB [Geothermobacter hydrogeniphilus]
MAEPVIFDTSMQMLRKVIELRQKSQQVIASNIANADTPGYRPRRLEFEKSLARAVSGGMNQKATCPEHLSADGTLSGLTGEVVTENGAVNVDQEMIKLSENQILYEAAVQMLNKKLALLKYVAQDGR